mgnify:CR=1 FL=1
MKTIGRYVRPYTGIIAFTMALKLAAALLDLLIPSFLASTLAGAVLGVLAIRLLERADMVRLKV